MGQHTYAAFFYRQRPEGPVQVGFVAPSYEIDDWARVPTKRTGNIRHFQRAEMEPHVVEVNRFFEEPSNSSPTAIVIGFDPFRSEDRVRFCDGDGEPFDLTGLTVGAPVEGTVRIDCDGDIDPQTRDELLEALLAISPSVESFVKQELADIVNIEAEPLERLLDLFVERFRRGQDSLLLEDLPGAGAEGEDDDEEEAEDEEGEALSDYVEDIDSETLELRAILAGLTPSERQIVIGRLEFLANFHPDLLADVGAEGLALRLQQAIDETKPALIIDGQHRVSGTKQLGEIPFMVCALAEASWAELAFQFIVTNRTARKVQESLLINIVGNSLSKLQRQSIEERLRRSGIRVGLIEAVMKVHEDEQSPFYQWLAFGLDQERGFLDAAAMRGKVIKLWYERQRPVRQMFDHLCDGATVGQRTDHWKSQELWFAYYCAFWQTVRERYKGTDVFSDVLADETRKLAKSPLMSATVLGVFQRTVLDRIWQFLRENAQLDGTEIADAMKGEKDFQKYVVNALKLLSPDFFDGWVLTGFDGSKGARDDLEAALRSVMTGEKLHVLKKRHRLWVAETA